MRVAMHQPHYLPWLGLIDKLDRADLFVYMDHVQYERKGWQNRNYVKSADGPVMLTVPVNAGSRDDRIVDKVVNDTRSWRIKHRRSLEQNYRSAPYWEDFASELLGIYETSWKQLSELAIATTRFVAEAFGIDTPFVRSTELDGLAGAKTELLVAACRAVGATTMLSGQGARDYIEDDRFTAAGITVEWQDFRHPEYGQLHPRAGFAPRMAAIDLLLNEGPSGIELLRAARSSPGRR
ncbi:MAG: hypothetical protein GEV11_21015 [Streptosporangiales bacterium]|nr:hypothetical protein [Streptosporangiales bacterium]